MICMNCKREIPDGSKFCPFCGTVQEESVGVAAERVFVVHNQEDILSKNEWKQLDFFQKLFHFNGPRLNRKPYNIALLILTIVMFAFYSLEFALGYAIFITGREKESLSLLFGFLGTLIPLLFVTFSVNFGIRRCHDLGTSGWFFLLMYVPIVQFYPVIRFSFCRGTYGPNQYGDDPLEEKESGE